MWNIKITTSNVYTKELTIYSAKSECCNLGFSHIFLQSTGKTQYLSTDAIAFLVDMTPLSRHIPAPILDFAQAHIVTGGKYRLRNRAITEETKTMMTMMAMTAAKRQKI